MSASKNTGKKKTVKKKNKPIPKPLSKNRALEVGGELSVIVHPQAGSDGIERYCQSQIVVTYNNAVEEKTEVILLSPERTALLLRLLNHEKSDFMSAFYAKK